MCLQLDRLWGGAGKQTNKTPEVNIDSDSKKVQMLRELQPVGVVGRCRSETRL